MKCEKCNAEMLGEMENLISSAMALAGLSDRDIYDFGAGNLIMPEFSSSVGTYIPRKLIGIIRGDKVQRVSFDPHQTAAELAAEIKKEPRQYLGSLGS